MARPATNPLMGDQTALGDADAGAGGLSRTWTQAGALSVAALCLFWAFWPTLRTMADRWSHDPQYSHGFLVPLFAAVVLWHRRELVPKSLAPNWWGLVLLLLGVSLH